MIGRGILKADDYYRFGKLVAKLEELGAYLVQYSPKKSAVLAWFLGGPESKPVKKAKAWLDKSNYRYELSTAKNANWTIIKVWWRK